STILAFCSIALRIEVGSLTLSGPEPSVGILNAPDGILNAPDSVGSLRAPESSDGRIAGWLWFEGVLDSTTAGIDPVGVPTPRALAGAALVGCAVGWGAAGCAAAGGAAPDAVPAGVSLRLRNSGTVLASFSSSASVTYSE